MFDCSFSSHRKAFCDPQIFRYNKKKLQIIDGSLGKNVVRCICFLCEDLKSRPLKENVVKIDQRMLD